MAQPAAARPTVQVYNGNAKSVGGVPMPAVCLSPIRNDIVQQVWVSMAKNKRQPYAVSEVAGHQHSAESWGTGRAVSRIPRVSGGGTHRAGQAAFGNMCRKGRMFAPTKTWRRWNRRINQKAKRYAVCSAIAASTVTPLVQARGHKIEKVKQIPLVVSDSTITKIEKTAQAEELLVKLNAFPDVEKAWDSRHIRAGKGKLRGRRYKMKRGPLVVYTGKPNFVRAFRNLPGVEFCRVEALNLLFLAPGSHLGRFIIWQESAFRNLDKVFGTFTKKSTQKTDFHLPRPLVSNADLARIINSDEIQSVVRPVKQNVRRHFKKNPLKNPGVLYRLNPYAVQQKRERILKREAAIKARREKAQKKARNPKAKRTARKKSKAAFLKTLHAP